MSKKPNKPKQPGQAVDNSQLLVNRKTLIGIAVAVVVVIAIVLAVFLVNRTPSNAAAKVGDTYITEEEVAEKIQTYRQNYGLTDDGDFADFLNYYGETVSQFRESAINDMATEMLVKKRAEELGLTVTDDEVQARYDEIKGDNDDSEGSVWATVLANAGLTEEILKERYRYTILQDKVFAKDVTEREATDDEILYYLQEYLAETTQVHISHIVITGDATDSVAAQCYSYLTAAQNDGTLTPEFFAATAKVYSTEENVDTTGGSVGWSGCGLLSDSVLETLNNMETEEVQAGTLLGLIQNDDGSYEIAYIDQTYTFPESSEITSLSDLDLPDDLVTVIQNAAKTQVAYYNDCSSYLTKLLENASITYYSMPNNAAYNVSLA